MRYSWRKLLTLLLVAAAGILAGIPRPAHAVAEGEDTALPHRLPSRWREDPEQYRRLKEDWKAFHKLPVEKQERLRLLDEELNDEPPAVRARLWAVLDRYTAWLERLDDKDRQQIESAPDNAKKVEIIRSLRERDWVSHLARAQRERIDQAPPDERAKLVEQLRQKERQHRTDWQTALSLQGEPIPSPNQPELSRRIKLYEEKSLIPTLTHTERDELAKAGRSSWSEHAQKLTELAAKHPIQVPPSERVGVVSFADLPKGYAQQLVGRPAKPQRDGEGHRLHELQGRWPNFALTLDRVARNRRLSPPEKPLGPCEQKDFVKEVREFIDELRKDTAAANKLDETRGKWPDYPFAVMELAKEKKKRVPGTFLPGSKEFWDQAKVPPPE
jgi:hypothetical protein